MIVVLDVRDETLLDDFAAALSSGRIEVIHIPDDEPMNRGRPEWQRVTDMHTREVDE